MRFVYRQILQKSCFLLIRKHLVFSAKVTRTPPPLNWIFECAHSTLNLFESVPYGVCLSFARSCVWMSVVGFLGVLLLWRFRSSENCRVFGSRRLNGLKSGLRCRQGRAAGPVGKRWPPFWFLWNVRKLFAAKFTVRTLQRESTIYWGEFY